MDLGLKDKVVVITGGTRGIGEACARKFMEEGAKTVVCDVSHDAIENWNRAENPELSFAMYADVSNLGDMNNLAAEAVSRFGTLDVWVNNAGIYPNGCLEDMPLDLWQKTLDINVNGPLYGARAAIPYMKAKEKGVIINAASFATLMPTATRGAYGITKAAVGHLTKVLGAELAPYNIRVVSYMPGFVATDLTTAVIGEYALNEIKKQVAQNRYGTPEEIAPMVVFLASDACSFITGTGVSIDGGKYCVQNPHMVWEKLNTK